MDPLSILGTILAIQQSGDKVVAILQTIRRAAHAPEQLNALINEISDEKTVVSHLRDLLQLAHDNGIDIGDLSPLGTHVALATGHLVELENVIVGRLTKATGKVDRITWARLGSQLESMRRNLQQDRVKLSQDLSALSV